MTSVFELEWEQSDTGTIRVSEDLITDTHTHVKATATYDGHSHQDTATGALIDLHQHRQH